ncbi:hypothetical protein H8S90_15200 [Olivibacter sp. SDN3]|uniref:hypothetical protein n=1 Tax=Olivibacter sp. SDN3 TaxID=2764720 RepID=UPI0016518689|nr:hypothetical protein [Olivibacter sp. SDN3]QNL48149.1 hypothetical protein H8S90_15200 [Olivibacter sp. SDN3]
MKQKSRASVNKHNVDKHREVLPEKGKEKGTECLDHPIPANSFLSLYPHVHQLVHDTCFLILPT